MTSRGFDEDDSDLEEDCCTILTTPDRCGTTKKRLDMAKFCAWVVVLALVVAFAIRQVELVENAQSNPVWQSNLETFNPLAFPVTEIELLELAGPLDIDYLKKHLFCAYNPIGVIDTANATSYLHGLPKCQTDIVVRNPTQPFAQQRVFLQFNVDSSAHSTGSLGTMVVGVEKVGITQLGRTGIVYLSDKDDFVGVEDMVKSANFYMTLNKAIDYYAIATKEISEYESGVTTADFTAIPSTVSDSSLFGINLFITYSSNVIEVRKQVVGYTWVDALGAIGGALSGAEYVHLVLFWLVVRVLHFRREHRKMSRKRSKPTLQDPLLHFNNGDDDDDELLDGNGTHRL